MRAIILAGGRGTRLNPLTQSLPKPLVPVFDRPLIFHQIDWLRANGVTEIVVSVGYLADRLLEALAIPVPGVRLRIVREEEPLGTAGAVAFALQGMRGSEPVLVIPGDALSDINLQSFYDAFSTAEEPMALIIHEVADPRGFGVVTTDGEGRVTAFLEKPAGYQGRGLVNTGIYAVRPESLAWDGARPRDFAYDVFPELVACRALRAYRAAGYWSDLGTLAQYRQAHFDVLDGVMDLPAARHRAASVKLAPSVRIVPPVWLGDQVVIEAEATVGPYAVIGSGSRLGPWTKVSHAILGRQVVLGAETRVEGAVVADDVMTQGPCRIAQDAAVGRAARLYWGSRVGAGERVPERYRVLAERHPAQGA
ncbi:MAG: NDP-sugar synthase [Firmicutes bacterium]|nr:NDP-sugar synthase [Bacillota bacterium]